jgi:RNA polymerase sigma-70 factor (ECF subfamily)
MGPVPPSASDAADHTDRLSRALDAAVERFRGYILGIGRRHGLSEADAGEIVQDVRVRLWRSRGDPETLSGVGSSYVYRVAASAALDLVRRRRARRTGADVVVALDDAPIVAEGTPADALEERELEDRVFRAVGTLGPARRPVVRMHLAGYDREEIAATLGWTVGRVRNLLSRGLADLRAVLTRDGIGPEGTT